MSISLGPLLPLLLCGVLRYLPALHQAHAWLKAGTGPAPMANTDSALLQHCKFSMLCTLPPLRS